MGLTSVSLGHGFPDVVQAVVSELSNGVNFQRPSILERTTAERFLDLLPVHDMIKFAKSGSIVTTAAVKLARAATGRSKVAFPGDHPFYSYDDWFIGKTQCNRGVPEEVSSLSLTFDSCNLDSLRNLFLAYPGEIACVISEPQKSGCGFGCSCSMDVGQYLREAIELCHEFGALFILDEMITGFKTDFPGSITKFGLEPDMATWGKGIANGFAFCALTGKKEVMEIGGITNVGAEKVFLISTTHGGETHALAAANATIKVFEEHDVIGHNHAIGAQLISGCKELLVSKGMEKVVSVLSAPWFPVFGFHDINGNPSPGLRTLAMQEMISRGVLFQGAFAPCYSHSSEDVEYFIAAFEEMLSVLATAVDRGHEEFLFGNVAMPVFRKYL
jgi:spore coat polysaccharide biosynthesis protein SpsF